MDLRGEVIVYLKNWRGNEVYCIQLIMLSESELVYMWIHRFADGSFPVEDHQSRFIILLIKVEIIRRTDQPFQFLLKSSIN